MSTIRNLLASFLTFLTITLNTGIKCQLFYTAPPTPTTETNPISNSTSTNNISSTTVHDICQCDFLTNACDPLCCCDTSCTDSEIDYWKSSFSFTCGQGLTSNSDKCYKDSFFYAVNERKGLVELGTEGKKLLSRKLVANFE
jgi:hypothetical protein